MKVTLTRYVHACMVVQTPKGTALFDPGMFTWESGLLDIALLPELDDIIITHEHFDHFHVPFVLALRKRFPKVPITTTPSAVAQLKEAGVTNVATVGNERLEVFVSPHASLEPLGVAPEQIGVHYAGVYTQPGDTQDIPAAKAILALPMTGPWGSAVAAATVGAALHPQFLVPIHDWHWNDTARQAEYGRFKTFFSERNSSFIPLQDGVSMTLPVNE